jgi:S1-C subfamily serine protease
VVWEDGVVVTTHHALERDEDIVVGLADGGKRTAMLAGRDPGTDLAALRVEGLGAAPPSWAELDGLKVGHLVMAVGRPGRTAQARWGVVAALGDSWRTAGGGKLDRYLEADLSLFPGFSGSALVDASGRVRGLNTAGLLRGAATTVPTPTVRRVVEALLSHGEIRRGYLGIGTQPVRLGPELEAKLGQATGLLVSSVQPGSPAAQAGVALGDVLLALDGTALGHPAELFPLLEEDRIGARARARVARGGEPRELEIVVGSREGR